VERTGSDEMQLYASKHRTASVSTVPPEVLSSVASFHRRGDVATLAQCAAVSRMLCSHYAPLLHRVFTCRACHAPLFHRREVEVHLNMSSHRMLEDGPAMAIWPPSKLRKENVPVHCHNVQSLIQLAKEAQTLHRASTLQDFCENASSDSTLSATVNNLECDNCGLFIGLSIFHQKACMEFVVAHIVSLILIDGPCTAAAASLHCSGARRVRGQGTCGQVLCDRDDVLSKCHCWRPPGGALEPAWYVNGIKDGSAIIGEARRQHLAQGLMEVSDVSCSACGGVIGWYFSNDCDPCHRNKHQTGRFGLCTSSLLELRDEVNQLRDEVNHQYRLDSFTESDTETEFSLESELHPPSHFSDLADN